MLFHNFITNFTTVAHQTHQQRAVGFKTFKFRTVPQIQEIWRFVKKNVNRATRIPTTKVQFEWPIATKPGISPLYSSITIDQSKSSSDDIDLFIIQPLTCFAFDLSYSLCSHCDVSGFPHHFWTLMVRKTVSTS